MPNAGVLLVQSEYIGMLMNPEYEKHIEATCNIGNPIINLDLTIPPNDIILYTEWCPLLICKLAYL